MKKGRAVVIGAGIGGLAAAIRLAAKGYNVSVLEQSEKTGGKISQLRLNGFRFDKGPSLLTMPWLIDELFTLSGESPSEHFKYSRLEQSCKYFWEDGSTINAWQDFMRFAEEVEKNSDVPIPKLRSFFEKSRQLYDITSESFLFNSLHKLQNYRTGPFLKTIANSFRLDPFVSMHDRNVKWFGHEKIVQLFDRYATYNGSDPYKAPATLNIIPHLEHNLGTYFPGKGIYDIPASLTGLAERKGIEFILNTGVSEIIIENRTVKGIKTADGPIEADIVVNNTDINLIYGGLIPSARIPSRFLKQERSTSALIFYWAVGTKNSALELHNILFSDDYKREFKYLFEEKTISSDPTVYIYISSRVVKDDAPPGCENWYVMINAPENTGQDWDMLISEARKNIIAKIDRILKISIESHILSEKVSDPRTIEKETGSFNGALYGFSSNSRFSAFNRHPNFRKNFKNLYFAGGSVHPGGGIPLCLASARIIDKEISPL